MRPWSGTPEGRQSARTDNSSAAPKKTGKLRFLGHDLLIASVVSDCDSTTASRQRTIYEKLNFEFGIDWGDSFRLVRNNRESAPALGYYEGHFGEIQSNLEEIHGLLDSGVLDHIHGVFAQPPTAIALKAVVGDGGVRRFELPFDLKESSFFPLRVMSVCSCPLMSTDDSGILRISGSKRSRKKKQAIFERAFLASGRGVTMDYEGGHQSHASYCIETPYLVNFDPLDVFRLLQSWVDAFGPLPSLLTDHSGTAFLNDSAFANRKANVRLFSNLNEDESRAVFQVNIPGSGSLLVDDPDSVVPLAEPLYQSGIKVVNPSGISGWPTSRPIDLPVEKTRDRSGTAVWLANRLLPSMDPSCLGGIPKSEITLSRLSSFACRTVSCLRSRRESSERFAPIYTHLGSVHEGVELSRALDVQAHLDGMKYLASSSEVRGGTPQGWPSRVHWVRASNLYCGAIVEANQTVVRTGLRSTRLDTEYPDAWFWGTTLYNWSSKQRIFLNDRLVDHKIVARKGFRWRHILLPEMHIQEEPLTTGERKMVLNSIGMPQVLGFLSAGGVAPHTDSSCIVHLENDSLQLCISTKPERACQIATSITCDSEPDHYGYRWVGVWAAQHAANGRFWLQGLTQSFIAESFVVDSSFTLALARPRYC